MLPLERPDTRPAAGPEIWIRRLEAKESIMFLSVSPKTWRFTIHWDGNHSSPHYKDKSRCPGCRAKCPQKYRSYLFGLNNSNKNLEFLELTPGAEEELESLIMPGDTYRGLRIEVTRGNGAKTRLKVINKGYQPHLNGKELPVDRDPAPTLCRLWGITFVPDGVNGKPPLSFGD